MIRRVWMKIEGRKSKELGGLEFGQDVGLEWVED
jgi:hypothetical protein